MLRNFRLRLLLLCLSTLLANGCNTSTPGTTGGDAATTPTLVDEGRGKGYEFHIHYPELQPEWSSLARALRDFGAAEKRDLLAATSGPERPAGAAVYKLELKFDIARHTENFVSVLAEGSNYTGGAHGMPIVSSFVLHTGDDKLMTLPDLFTDPAAALDALSKESRHQLEGRYETQLRDETSSVTAAELSASIQAMHDWVDRGTEAKAENFSVFLVDGIDAKAIGLTLTFPPYQVAAYAAGTQQIEVPAKIFYELLKPEYRNAFSVDTEELKRGTR